MKTAETQYGSLVFHDWEEPAGGVRPPLEVYPVETVAGPGWLGLHEGRITWLSVGELDEQQLQDYWKGEVRLTGSGPVSAGDLEAAALGQAPLHLMPAGTAFQTKVWKQLLGIPFSTTCSYGELAAGMGEPKSARAVGSAVGANPVAWLVPCHRVLPGTGGLGGYRWGSPAKEALLNWESQQHPSGAPSQDMEDHQKLEAMLLNARRYEDTAKLAGNIAHDLNNLLAPIRMATELLKRKLEDPSVDRYVEIIETSTGRARSVIQEILAYSRESETSETAVIDVNVLLQELEHMAGDTFPDTIRLAFTYQESAPRIELDPHQLHRSILNLMVNALDAIDGDGTIGVRVSTHDVGLQAGPASRTLVPGRYVCISVSDSGCGIADDIRGQIFDPFFTTKPKEKGTGLGLASVFGIVARAGGYIDLESEVDKGTTFHLFLPEAGEA